MVIKYSENFNRPEYIIIHHSATPRTIGMGPSIQSFNYHHRSRFPTMKASLGYNIAYHFVIAENGEIRQTRRIGDVGHHASNYKINLRSIGICMIGNFDKERPTKKQEDSLRQLILRFKVEYDINYIYPHRIFNKAKSCPGKLLSDDWIANLSMLDELVRSEKGGFYFVKRGDNGKQKIDTSDKGVGGLLTVMSRAFGVKTVKEKFLTDKQDKKYF